jgi:hypothetical protein
MAFLKKAALLGGFLLIFVVIFGVSYGFIRVTAWIAHLPIVPGLLAFLLWCVTDTDLKPEYVTNSEGRITVSRVLSTIAVRIGLCVVVFILVGKIARHFPLPLVDFAASFCRWIALLLILQYAWTIVSTTGKLAIVVVMGRFGSSWALDSLDRGYASLRQMERRAREPVEGTSGINSQAAAACAEVKEGRMWVRWYLKSGPWRWIRIVLFVVFGVWVFGCALSGLVDFFSLVTAAAAVWGRAWGIGFTVCAWPVLIIPFALAYGLLKGFPTLWLRPDARTRERILYSVFISVALLLASDLVQRGIGHGIGWIADRNPCAALAARVTGSRVPSDCH